MAKKINLNLVGMVTDIGSPQAPGGSCTMLQNCNVEAPGVLVKREGFARAANGFGGPGWSLVSTKQLGSNVLMNFGSNTAATGLRYGDGTVAPTLLTTPNSADVANTAAARMKAAVLGQSHYLTGTNGTLRLNADLSLDYAGGPQAWGFYQAGVGTVLTGTNQWLTDGNGVAYRVVFGRRLPDNAATEVMGAVSGRRVVENRTGTSGWAVGVTRSVTVRVLIPYHVRTSATALTSSYFFRLYRSQQVNTSTSNPNDELQQCYEYVLTAGDITAGYVDVTDSCPESALGAYLYTNTVSGGDVSTGAVASQGVTPGILATNDPPPVATDVCEFANCLVYSNLTPPRRLFFSIIAVGAAGNVLTAGDVLTVNGFTFTAVAGAPANSQEFQVVTTGTVAFNIRNTAINLCEAINATRGPIGGTKATMLTATYVGNDASPGTIGRILLESYYCGGSDFVISASAHGSAYLPPIGGSGASSSASPLYLKNGLAVSKPLQADAVPPANYFQVGRADTLIQRLMPLRDQLFIFTDDGIYRMRGDGPYNFVVERFSTTFHLAARESCVLCEDAIYAWGYEGLARITSAGVEFIDTPIRNYAQYWQLAASTNFASTAFAVAYRKKRRVVFFIPDDTTTPNCSVALVYHLATNAWSAWGMGTGNPYNPQASSDAPKSCGVVRYSDDNLYLGNWNNASSDSYLFAENNVATSSASRFYDVNNAGVNSYYDWLVEMTDCVPDPSSLEQWREVHVYWCQDRWRNLQNYQATINIQMHTELSTSVQTAQVLQPASVTGFGTDVGVSRVACPREAAIGVKMFVSALASSDQGVAISGLALLYEPMGDEVGL